MQGVRALCDKYNIVMIVDEVMAGFGRTGEWFAVDHWHVTPDIMTMAKGLTSGYAPLGAVAMKPEIAATFNERVFEGGLTYNGHPISLAAALSVIEVMQQDHLVTRSSKTGEYLKKVLNELAAEHPSVGDVRSIGMFAAIELVKNRETKEPMSPFGTTSKEMLEIRKYLLEHGVYATIHWNIILIIPPLIISEEELNQGFEVINQALAITDKYTIKG